MYFTCCRLIFRLSFGKRRTQPRLVFVQLLHAIHLIKILFMMSILAKSLCHMHINRVIQVLTLSLHRTLHSRHLVTSCQKRSILSIVHIHHRVVLSNLLAFLLNLFTFILLTRAPLVILRKRLEKSLRLSQHRLHRRPKRIRRICHLLIVRGNDFLRILLF
jgi:hypothetical protein